MRQADRIGGFVNRLSYADLLTDISADFVISAEYLYGWTE